MLNLLVNLDKIEFTGCCGHHSPQQAGPFAEEQKKASNPSVKNIIVFFYYITPLESLRHMIIQLLLHDEKLRLEESQIFGTLTVSEAGTSSY